MASASQEGHEAAPSLPSAQMLRVTLLSSEWRSTKGGVSTINRELAIQLAKLPNVEVSVYLPECSEDDKRVAASHRVKLIEAEKLHGLEPDLWLSSLPHHHAVDCVIGHGVDLGKQLQLIQRQHHCKWVQVVHSDPEELGMFKSNAGAISKAQKQHQLEVKLCELSDQVVAVGPKLGDAFSGYLRPFRKDANVFILTPGIFSEFAGVKQASEDRKAFSVLVLGHGDSEDLQLKGYDIAAKAIAELKDESRPYKLKVVGVPSGQEEEVAEMFLQQGIHRSQLVVRSFKEREQLAAQFCEVDLAVMPSRSEGFGLAALEALSAGLPVLVSGNSGLGEALKGVLHGSAYVLNSEDPKEWGRAIRYIREKRRDLRLMEAKSICEEYAKKYSWEEQCRSLAKRMSDLAAGFPGGSIPASVVECGQAAFPTVSEDDLGSGAEDLAKMQKTKEGSTREKPAESEGTCTVENAEAIKDTLCPAELIDQIRQLFTTREGCLAPFPWCEGEFFFHLDDIFTRLIMVSREKTRGVTTDKVVEMSAIFQPHEECQNPRSVLIEGKPGMGKTTYSNKVAYDWATKKPEEGNHFQNFQVVLLLRCHDIHSNLQDAIVDQILPVDAQERGRDKFLEFIEHNQPNVLLVLDGLDELSKDKLPEFSAIIEGRSRIFGQCSLVVTARPEAGIAVRKSFDTLLEIEGFTLDDAIDFISKFFKKKGENLAQMLIDKVRRDKNLQELIANPLNTSLLCLLCEDLHGLLPENRTQLYVDIVECVLRRYKKKKGLLATCDDLMEEYKPQLLHLGWIALNGLHEDKMFFEEKQLANHASDLSEMGFLSVQPGSSKRRPCRHYAFLHKSFQELFAAYYLCCQLISHEISPDTLVADDRYFSELRQVLLFTCGMLAEPSPDATMALIKSSTARINVKGDEREILLVLECINECKKEGSNFHVDLARAFGSFLTITELEIGSELGETGAAALTDALRTNTTLTKLSLSCSSFRETETAALADVLRTNTTLTKLSLSLNYLGKTGAAALADVSRTNTTLTKLSLSCSNCRETETAALADVLRTNTTLTKLSLSCSNFGETEAVALADALRTNTTLTELYLSENNLGESGAAALAEALRIDTTLTKLYLYKNYLGETGGAGVADALRTKTTLTELDFSDKNLNATGAAAVVDVLRTNTTLTKLYLSGNNLGWSGAAAAVVYALRTNITLTVLDLSLNYLGKTGAAALADVLRTNTTLTWLYLSDNNLGETGAAALADALRTNTTLTLLDLSRNNLGETGAAALADALRTNTTLTWLYLSDNNLGETGAAAIADALRTNTTLTLLDLYRNKLSEFVAEEIQKLHGDRIVFR